MARSVLVLGGVINGVERMKKELRDDDYFSIVTKVSSTGIHSVSTPILQWAISTPFLSRTELKVLSFPPGRMTPMLYAHQGRREAGL